MTACCHLSRREFLRWAALVGATPLLASLADQERAYAQGAAVALPISLELVTLTETTAIITWFTGDPTRPDTFGRLAPAPADTEVLLGTSPATMQVVHHDATPTPYHYVELTGLEPGQTYFYVARSGGLPATPSTTAYGNPVGTSTLPLPVSGPYLFQTPEPPPGRHLFTIALGADMHLGETVAGLATTQAGVEIPPGIRQLPGRPPYAEVMAGALAPEVRARGAQLVLIAGDVTSEAAAIDAAHAKTYLDRFGAHGRDYLVARGNHDRPHTGAKTASCRTVRNAPGYHDCFGDTFFGAGPTWFAHEAFGMRILGLDTYDKIGNGGDNGVLSDPQWAFVREELGRDKDQPTLVFGHHPVTVESTLININPVRFDLAPQQARQLEELYVATPGVFLHHAGHTHRNKQTRGLTATDVVFQEVSAVKEYPGGYTLLRVFTGGYALNFYKFRSALAQEWSERSRPEYAGLAPYYTFGNVNDRNSVVVRDLSGLRSTRDQVAPVTTARPAAQVLPVTGAGAGPALAAGAAALAIGAAARRLISDPCP
ncbi:MAG TPA: metallophosphoesterase family protein [Acidimicrobiales bacterium]|nr:metallophosphoesterase family protein [Acidimicrobiales bacterium]